MANRRTYKKKMERNITTKEKYMVTAKEFLAKAFNVRKASAKYSINFMTLQVFCKRVKEGSGSNFTSNSFTIYFKIEN
jgi:hypothetical protein